MHFELLNGLTECVAIDLIVDGDGGPQFIKGNHVPQAATKLSYAPDRHHHHHEAYEEGGMRGCVMLDGGEWLLSCIIVCGVKRLYHFFPKRLR